MTHEHKPVHPDPSAHYNEPPGDLLLVVYCEHAGPLSGLLLSGAVIAIITFGLPILAKRFRGDLPAWFETAESASVSFVVAIVFLIGVTLLRRLRDRAGALYLTTEGILQRVGDNEEWLPWPEVEGFGREQESVWIERSGGERLVAAPDEEGRERLIGLLEQRGVPRRG